MIPTDIATRADLNAAERDNILDARLWVEARARPIAVDRLLQISTLDSVHRRMFGDVWEWAGKRRRRVTDIGVPPSQIVTKLRDALDDAQFWHSNGSFDALTIAVRLHHRLVEVHPYVNGNGRHARFVADLFLRAGGQPPLRWHTDGAISAASRARYIAALRAADVGDYAELIAYATGGK